MQESIINYNGKKAVFTKGKDDCSVCIFYNPGKRFSSSCEAGDLDCFGGHYEEYNEDIRTIPTVESISKLQQEVHQDNVVAGWWTDLSSGTNLAEEARNNTRLGKALVAEKLCLIHSEVSEAMEASRKNLMDDKLPHRFGVEVELADAVIRILDLCGALNLDLAGAIQEKLMYNKTREDHKIENRIGPNGKSY